MFLGKKEVKCYEVGVNYFEAIGHQEGVFFDITDSGIILRIYFCGVTAHEAGQFRSEKPFEMRLAGLRDIIFLLFKFGELNWMDAPYNVHLSLNLTKLELPSDGLGLAMTVQLFDTFTGKLHCNRFLSLSTEMSRKLIKMVEEQKRKPFNVKEYFNDINSIYAAYPAKKLARMADCYYKTR